MAARDRAGAGPVRADLHPNPKRGSPSPNKVRPTSPPATWRRRFASTRRLSAIDPGDGRMWADLARIQTYSSALQTTADDRRARLAAARESAERAVEANPEDSTAAAIRALVYDWSAAAEESDDGRQPARGVTSPRPRPPWLGPCSWNPATSWLLPSRPKSTSISRSSLRRWHRLPGGELGGPR